MHCPACQHENPAGQKFCGQCGARLASACPSCSASNPPGQKFCGECGTALGQAGRGGGFAAPESYIPKHLAEKILTSRSALEGERKQVTVLFADMKGSMELLADGDPEEARKLLDPMLERMMEAVHRYEGTVNQVMGDGIMALFGAPVAHEDHAVRACYAALRMQDSVKRYAGQLRQPTAIPVAIRVGLNSGEVVVRSIGSDLHMDYTAVGQTTHLAARMEQRADPGTILIAPSTFRLAESFLQVVARGPMEVKGLSGPIDVFELVGVSAMRSRLQAAAARGLSRLVGRAADVEQLSRALESAREGRGQMAAIVGDPGVGKSRLVFELTHSQRASGWRILECRSVSYGKAMSYMPLIELLKGYFGIAAQDTYGDIREKVTEKSLAVNGSLEGVLPALLALLDAAADDPQWQDLDPLQRRQRTQLAIKRLLLSEAELQPLIVVLEDLQWIDSESQAFLESLLEHLPTARMLLLVNYRPEYSHPWGSKSFYSQVRLDPLPPKSARELLDTLLGADASLTTLKHLLASRTAGNPLFVEESVRALIETEALRGEPGSYRLAQVVETIDVPTTVQAILASRMDRLPLEEKRLLQCAAVIGHEVPQALLEAIAEGSGEECRRHLAHLQAGEFLYSSSTFPEPEYVFKHALTHEVAYASLLKERRRGLHGKIVDAIGRLYGERGGGQMERLAYHAVQAERWGEAVGYLRQAADRAAMRSAHRQAVAFLNEALAALGHLSEGSDNSAQAIDIRLALRHSLLPLGQFQRTLEHLHEARALAEALADRKRLAWVSAYLSVTSTNVGNAGDAVGHATRATEWAEELNDPILLITGNYYLGLALLCLGSYVRAADVFTRNIGLTPRWRRDTFAEPGQPSVYNRAWLTFALAELGQFDAAQGRAREALGIAQGESLEDRFTVWHGHFAVGVACLRQGILNEATVELERCATICRDADFPLLLAYLAPFLTIAWAEAGRASEAITLLEPIVRQAPSSGLLVLQALRELALGEAYLGAGRIRDAAEFAAHAVDSARAQGERGSEAWALRLLGEIRLRSEAEPGQVHASYRAAFDLAEELEMRPLVAHCHLGLGKLYRRTGDRQQTQEHFTTATTMYREMNMRFWLEKAEAELNAR